MSGTLRARDVLGAAPAGATPANHPVDPGTVLTT
jgi:hypothetical protein